MANALDVSKLRAPRSFRFRSASLFILIVALVVGLLATSQLSEPDRFRKQLSTESEGDLARILASLSSESTALQQQLATLRVEQANLRNQSQNEASANEQTSTELNSLMVLSGTVAVTGPGIEIVIQDPNRQVGLDVLINAVQELRDAGAEALTCNAHRIGARSAFTLRNGAVFLDSSPISTPITISAIGPAATMEGGLKIPGGALDTLNALNGVNVDVHRSTSINMPALEQVPTFKAARPVGTNK